MKRPIIFVTLVIAASICLTAKAPAAGAQSCDTAAAPDCPYGYYDTAPYDCAPYGYYGPEWFSGGIFIGAGPWFHGPEKFYGHVDHKLDYRKGYKGPTPARGAAPAANRAAFKGQAMHDPKGQEAPRGKK